MFNDSESSPWGWFTTLLFSWIGGWVFVGPEGSLDAHHGFEFVFTVDLYAVIFEHGECVPIVSLQVVQRNVTESSLFDAYFPFNLPVVSLQFRRTNF